VKHLIFQIAAPIMSWGNEQARSERTSDGHPRKSAVLGMVGAALGKPREDPWHAETQDALGFAALVLQPGTRMTDYHTVLTPQGPKRYETRAAEISASDYTVQTFREYLCDAYFLVGFWQLPGGRGAELEAMAKALEEPVWEVYAGRKSCPLSLPAAPLLIDVPSLEEAFRGYKDRIFAPLRPERQDLAVYWESHPSTALKSAGAFERHDGLVSRAKRLYRTRSEHQGTIAF
jgi:CRISPR system Cascade subunit CasD